MKKFIIWLLVAILAGITFSLVPQTANAAEPKVFSQATQSGDGPWVNRQIEAKKKGMCSWMGCGIIVRGPDAGFDPGLLLRCQFGDPYSNFWLNENQDSRWFCRDTDELRVPSNGYVLWHNGYGWVSMNSGYPGWVKIYDGQLFNVILRAR